MNRMIVSVFLYNNLLLVYLTDYMNSFRLWIVLACLTRIIFLSFVDLELELPKRLYAEGLEPQVKKINIYQGSEESYVCQDRTCFQTYHGYCGK